MDQSIADTSPSSLAVSTVCPVCGGETDLYCTKNAYDHAWNIRRCRVCGHGFIQNRPTLEYLKNFYETHEEHLAMVAGDISGAEHDVPAITLVNRAARLTPGRGYSLDIGSGAGGFSYHLHKLGFRPVMLDLDPRAAHFSNQIPGGLFFTTSFEEFQFEHPFDVIVMSQVLEHALDPHAWLVHAKSLLSPNGVLCVALPNFGGVYRMLGSRDPFLIPPMHLNFFTADSLRRGFEAAGLKHLRSESISLMSVSHPLRNLGLKRRAVAHLWNAIASPILGLTCRGIILRAYATLG